MFDKNIRLSDLTQLKKIDLKKSICKLKFVFTNVLFWNKRW